MHTIPPATLKRLTAEAMRYIGGEPCSADPARKNSQSLRDLAWKFLKSQKQGRGQA